MGLFDKKYKEKDYIVSTADFKDRLDSLYRNASQMEGCGRLVTGLLMKLDQYNYPKGCDHAKLKAVDDRISRLIDHLRDDIQDKNAPAFTQHAEILFRAIEDSRQYGKERFDQRYIENEETMANSLGEIYNALNQKTEIEKTKNALLADAKKLDPSQKGEMQKIRLQFNALAVKEKELDNNINMWQANYNAAVEVESEYNTGRNIRKLSAEKMVKPAEITRITAENTAMLEQQMGLRREVLDTIREAHGEREGSFEGTQAGDAFDVAFETSNVMDGLAAVNGASVPASKNEADPFLSALNNF